MSPVMLCTKNEIQNYPHVDKMDQGIFRKNPPPTTTSREKIFQNSLRLMCQQFGSKIFITI